MKLYLETDEGGRIEVQDVDQALVDSKILIFFIKRRIAPDDLSIIRHKLIEATGKECIVLDDLFVAKIMGI